MCRGAPVAGTALRVSFPAPARPSLLRRPGAAMSEPRPAARARRRRPAPRRDKRRAVQRLLELVAPGPTRATQLIESLADAENKELIAPESRMMLEGVIRMADMTAGDVMVAAPRMDLLDIDAPLRGAAARRHPHRPLALSGLRGAARQHHRHPDGEGPAEAAALARPEPAHAAAAGRLRARVEGPERAAARLPLQPQPPRDRHRRVRHTPPA